MTVELLKGRGKLRRLLCSLLAALMLLPWVMQGAWAAGGTREVKSREIAVVFPCMTPGIRRGAGRDTPWRCSPP